MEKKTAAEILDIIEDIVSVEGFAYGDFEVPADFVASDDVQKMVDANQKAYEDLVNHPTHDKNYKERQEDASYQAVREVWSNSPNPREVLIAEWLLSLGLGRVVEVEQKGGEGQGDEWYSVKHFIDHDVYIQTDGYYSSYNGTDFHDGYGYEVRPKEVMVTIYAKVEK